MQGYKYNQLSEEKLNMKITYYENYLDLVEKLNPGYTIWRGEVLYQLHYPLLFKANKAYEAGNLKKDDFMAILKKIKSSLEESQQCLQPEAEGTKEAQTVQMVMVDPSNPNHFSLQQHPISVATSTSSSPVTTLAFEENNSQSVQQSPRSFARVKTNDGETWKFIQIG